METYEKQKSHYQLCLFMYKYRLLLYFGRLACTSTDKITLMSVQNLDLSKVLRFWQITFAQEYPDAHVESTAHIPPLD